MLIQLFISHQLYPPLLRVDEEINATRLSTLFGSVFWGSKCTAEQLKKSSIELFLILRLWWGVIICAIHSTRRSQKLRRAKLVNDRNGEFENCVMWNDHVGRHQSPRNVRRVKG